ARVLNQPDYFCFSHYRRDILMEKSPAGHSYSAKGVEETT
ncbi:unnamed protein product, partial [marine sediment metagenome]